MESYIFRCFIFIVLLLGFTIIFNSCSTENTPVYQLTTSSNPSEGGSVSPAEGEYDEREQVQVTANSNEHWVFQEWQGGLSSSQNPASVIMDSDKNITALFVKKEYPLTVNIEGEGTVSEQVVQAKDYEHGTLVELTPTPSEGWKFVEWNGDIQNTETVIQVTVDSEINVTVVFEKKSYPLNIAIEGEGTVEEEIIQSKSTEYDFGTEVQLKAIPDDNWIFDLWSGDFEGNENPITIKIDDESNITANFITTPTLRTSSIENINFETATSGGEITDNGGSEVIERGICWSSSEKPTINDSCTNDGEGSGSFKSSLKQLNLGTTYYVRAYAKNSVGISYGNQLSFRAKDSIEDIDGNKYKVVKIGSQFWMAENLRTTKYNDGSKIPHITDDLAWELMCCGAWSYYKNDSSYNSTYGKLYHHKIATESRSVCPIGWKIPDDSDWKQLINEFGGDNEAGGKLKSTDSKFWNKPNVGATNESGFSAKGTGFKSIYNVSTGIKEYGVWFSYKSGIGSAATGAVKIGHDDEKIERGLLYVGGLSIRCLMN